MKKPIVRTQVRLNEFVAQELKLFSEEKGVSMNQTINDLLEFGINTIESVKQDIDSRPMREADIAENLKNLDDEQVKAVADMVMLLSRDTVINYGYGKFKREGFDWYYREDQVDS